MIEDNNAVLLAEYRLLNACYSNPDFLYENGVTEDIFQHSQSKTIFNSIKSLYESEVPLTRESLWQDASNHDLGINNSIIDQVIDFTSQKPETVKDIVDSLNMAKRAAKAEKDIDEAKKLINSSLVRNDETNNKLKELLFSVEENLFTSYDKQDPMTLEEWGKVYQAEYLGRRNGKTYYFNDRILDALITTGPTPGSGGLITASSGMGKSSYVLNLINNLINRDIPVLYFSLEMGKIDTRSYSVPYTASVAVAEGDYVHRGDKLTLGSVDPKELIQVTDTLTTEEYILAEVQKAYRMQGVDIADKHVEVLTRQMLQKVRVLDPGETDILPGEVMDIGQFRDRNKEVIISGGIPATAQSVILGITKAALETNSFLSAASFQETTRVLTDASIRGKNDPLLGLKENVIIGKIIPAGTGMPVYRNMEPESDVKKPDSVYSIADIEKQMKEKDKARQK